MKIIIILIACLSLYSFTGCKKQGIGADNPLVNTECKHIETSWITVSSSTYEEEGIENLICDKCKKIIQTRRIPILTYSKSEILVKIKHSIVKVICYDFNKTRVLSEGTGIFIDEKGTFLTTAKFIEGAYFIKIKILY